jgi:hypothetical protein
MDAKLHYDTASQAIAALTEQEYTVDFNLAANDFIGAGAKYNINDFKIKDVYRYEGNSDPADEVSVYALESNNGVKGILVAGYGASDDEHTDAILEKLKNVKY